MSLMMSVPLQVRVAVEKNVRRGGPRSNPGIVPRTGPAPATAREVAVPAGPGRDYRRGMRLVSLLPSATEIVHALGLGDDLVGVTFECDEPPSARREKTVVVGGRDTTGMTPAEIDTYVKQQMAERKDLYTLHAGALAALQPELILTQDLCRV